MKKYPRLYRLSTVNLIYHGDCDFDLNPFRTDFTGNGGVGKSLIADLLQLIFVSPVFESATDSSGARPVSTMVPKISKIGYDFGYAILTIEKSPKQFIGIGVYIQNNTEQTKSFIVQTGHRFEEKSILETFNEPLSYKDFIKYSDNAVLPLDINAAENCVDSLLELRQLVIEEISHKKYFEILAHNDILPLKVTDYQKSIRIYKEIIRTFSRGSKLNFSKDTVLKRFLFGDEEVVRIWDKYEATKKSLENDISQHGTTLLEIDSITKKMSDLSKLLVKKDLRDKKYIEWLKANYGFCKCQYRESGNLFQENTKNAILGFKKLIAFKYFLEVKNTSFSDIQKNLNKKTEQFASIQGKFNTVKKVEKWLDKYEISDADELTRIFNTQLKNRKLSSQIKALEENLSNLKLLNSFQNSDWIKGYSNGIDWNNKIISETKEQISQKEAFETFSNLNNTNSLAYWVVNRNQSLTLDQESVLMHFQTLSTQKPSIFKKRLQYLSNPSLFFDTLRIEKENDNGFWLRLGEIYEFVEYVSTQQLSSTNFSKIRDNIEKWNESLKSEILVLKTKLTEYENLLKGVKNIDTELTNAYPLKEQIEIFTYNLELDIAESDFFQYLGFYANKETIEQDFAEWSGLEAHRNTISNNLIKIGTLINLVENGLELEENFKQVWENEEIYKESIEDAKLNYGVNPENWESYYNLSKILPFETYKRSFESFKEKEQNLKNADEIVDNINQIDKNGVEEINTEPLSLQVESKAAKDNYEADYRVMANYLSESEQQKVLDGEYNFMNLGIELLPEILRDKGIFEDIQIVSIVKERLELIQGMSKNFTRNKISSLKIILKDLKDTIDGCGTIRWDIDSFFKEQRDKDNLISGEFVAELNWNKGNINPKWLSEFGLQIDKNWNTLFIDADFKDLLSNKITFDEFTLTVFQKLSGVTRTKGIKEILDPCNYFELEFEMSNPNYVNTGISNSQNYSAVALLCIARLSIIEKKGNSGIRFMPIDEAESLGSNFDMLYKIAQDKDYQIITMSISPIISLEEINRTVYVLRRNFAVKEIPVNHTPKKMSNTLIELEEDDTNEMEVPESI